MSIQPRRTIMGKVIGYCRVSTEEQANKGATTEEEKKHCPYSDIQKGYSIASQQDMISTYCNLHELGEPTFLMDEGCTGSNTERPGLQTLLQLVQDKKVDHVVVVAIDRLSRSTMDLLDIVVRQFGDSIGFHSVREQLDTKSPMGRCVFTILAAFANLERDNISMRTKAALAEKKRRGERIGREPYGFLPGAGQLKIDPETFPVVKDILQMRGYGATLQQIADKLNERGVKSHHGGRWHPSSVKIVVGNRAVYVANSEETF
jgi:site-specific DNA recombinase